MWLGRARLEGFFMVHCVDIRGTYPYNRASGFQQPVKELS